MASDGRGLLDAGVLGRITPLGFRARSVMEGSVSGGHRSPLQGVSPEFADHREYVPGDDLKNLDWRVFARSDRFYIKRFEEESNLRCTFVVDASGSMIYRGQGAEGSRGRRKGPRGRGAEGSSENTSSPSPVSPGPSAPVTSAPSKFHFAATAAACLGSVLMRQRDAVGLVTFDNVVRDVLPCKANTRHFTQVLDTLAATEPGGVGSGETEVGGVLARVADRAGRGGMVVVLSDLLCDLDRLGEGLSRLRHGRHEVIVMQVLHGDEIDLPFNQSTMFRDIEGSPSGGAPEEVYGEPWAFRQAYQKEMQRFIADAHARCRQRGIDHVLLRTDHDLGVTLSRYLHGRRQS